MITYILDNIYVGNWQDARMYEGYFETFTVAFDSPYKGKHFYPLVDGKSPDNDKILQEAITDLYKTRKQLNPDDKILVHCAAGLSRSPTVVIGYMMVEGWTFEDSYNHMKKVRPEININYNLIDLLRTYN